MISSLELARICGVSQGTVDRALHNRQGISAATREKVLAAAKQYGYAPNPVARELMTGKSRMVGALLPQMNSVFFMDLFTAVKESLRAQGLRLLLAPYSDGEEFLALLCEFSVRRLGAVVLVPPVDHFVIPSPISRRMKVVSLIAPVKSDHAVFITPDELAAGVRAAVWLREQGCRRLLQLTYTRDSHAIRLRTRGFLQACDGWAARVSVLRSLDKESLLTRMAAEEMDGIFCHNDWLALQALHILQQQGIADRVRILGVDNSPTFNRLNSAISSLQYPYSWCASQVAGVITEKFVFSPSFSEWKVVEKDT